MPDPITLEVFKNLFISVAEEMGVALGRTAYSPNIKERRDYSCALFDPQGRMVAQAAHIPVHLGSMPASVQSALERMTFQPGDLVILNDPYLGGTHLPDITIIAPVFIQEVPSPSVGEGESEGEALVGFVANRGHHADIGGMTPGSLPLSTELYQEGVIIPPLKLAKAGVLNEELIELFLRNVRTPQERRGDLAAQIASARVGERRLTEIIQRYGWETVQEHMTALMDYSERITRATIRGIPAGSYSFQDYMDDDGDTPKPVLIQVRVDVKGDAITFDFTGTAAQTRGCINAPLAVTQSVCMYAIRCLMPESVPANDGCLRPIKVIAPKGSLLNPEPPHAVSGGNVDTAQRIVDVVFGALAQALPDRIPAASQGTMNNFMVGGHDPYLDKPFAYYETIAGGMGARPGKDGISGVHTHMTNTLNTPIEALEFQFPFRVVRYAIRIGSGGAGVHRGGDGLVREVQFLAPTRVTILSERRALSPYGLHGGEPGQRGENLLFRKDSTTPEALPSKVSLNVVEGDVMSICTPGGGGWGVKE